MKFAETNIGGMYAMKYTLKDNFIYIFVFLIAFNIFYNSSLLLFLSINLFNIYAVIKYKIDFNRYIKSKGLVIILLFSLTFNVISFLVNKQLYLFILLIIPSMYALGISIINVKEYNIEKLIISIALGFLFNVIFDCIYTFMLNDGAYISRNLNSIFSIDLYVSATIEALKLVFPIGIFIPLLLTNNKKYKLLAIFMIISVILINTVLLSRNILLDIVFAFLLVVIYKFDYLKSLVIKKKKTFYIIIVMFFFLLILIGFNSRFISGFFNIDRLLSDTARIKTLLLASSQLFQFPLGGNQMNLGELNYAHNMWLDVANVAGIIPFIILIIFTFRYIYILIKIGKNLPLPIFFCSNILLVGTLACFFEPILFSNAVFYSFLCLTTAIMEGYYLSNYKIK